MAPAGYVHSNRYTQEEWGSMNRERIHAPPRLCVQPSVVRLCFLVAMST